VLVRGGAPTDPRRNRVGGRGLSSAAWAVSFFVFACPSDAPPYIAVWYHGRLLDRDDSGTGRSAPPAAMVEEKTAGQTALMPMRFVSMRHVEKPKTPARRDIIGAYGGVRLHPWPLRIMHWVNAVVMLDHDLRRVWGNLR